MTIDTPELGAAGTAAEVGTLSARLKSLRWIAISCEPAGEEPDAGDESPGAGAFDCFLPVLGKASAPAEPGECAFNGLITNDKFCLTRMGQLRLSWPRTRGRQRRSVAPQLPGEVTHRGEEHAAAAAHVAGSARRRADRDRSAALGPGLPAPPPVGDQLPCAGRGANAEPAGDVPCA